MQELRPLKHRFDDLAIMHLVERFFHFRYGKHLAELVNREMALLMKLDELRDELIVS